MMENESLTGKKWRWEQIPARHDKKIGRGEGKRVRRYVIKIRLIVPMGCNGLLGAICLHSVSLQSLTLSSVYSAIEVALIKINHCKLPIEVKYQSSRSAGRPLAWPVVLGWFGEWTGGLVNW